MDFNIYLIGDKNLFKNENKYLDVLDECFDSGIKAFQLRQKDISIKELITLGRKIKKIIDKYSGIKLFINDRVDVALALNAYGVHLNKNSIPIVTVKKELKDLKVFYSAHSVFEVTTAWNDGADAVTFSPIFKTKNQNFGQGIDVLKKVVNSVNIPVFALGGINKCNVGTVKDAGVKHIAVMSGILKEDNIHVTVKSLLDNFI